MDVLTLVLQSQATPAAILLGVVVMIFTGVLVPGRTHKRELAAAYKVAEEHRLASEKKDGAIARLLDQNSALLAGVRIADKFYSDFVPTVEEHTQPRGGALNVGV